MRAWNASCFDGGAGDVGEVGVDWPIALCTSNPATNMVGASCVKSSGGYEFILISVTSQHTASPSTKELEELLVISWNHKTAHQFLGLACGTAKDATESYAGRLRLNCVLRKANHRAANFDFTFQTCQFKHSVTVENTYSKRYSYLDTVNFVEGSRWTG